MACTWAFRPLHSTSVYLLSVMVNYELLNDLAIDVQVCEEQQCEEQVFPLAVSYMDRFLVQRAISRQQLQLLAVTSMLLASKFRQCHPLSVDLLCAYTDNSVYPHEVRVRMSYIRN